MEQLSRRKVRARRGEWRIRLPAIYNKKKRYILALEVVKDKAHYQSVEKAIPHSAKHRVKGFPKDAYHIAFIGHKTRLRNILKLQD